MNLRELKSLLLKNNAMSDVKLQFNELASCLEQQQYAQIPYANLLGFSKYLQEELLGGAEVDGMTMLERKQYFFELNEAYTSNMSGYVIYFIFRELIRTNPRKQIIQPMREFKPSFDENFFETRCLPAIKWNAKTNKASLSKPLADFLSKATGKGTGELMYFIISAQFEPPTKEDIFAAFKAGNIQRVSKLVKRFIVQGIHSVIYFLPKDGTKLYSVGFGYETSASLNIFENLTSLLDGTHRDKGFTAALYSIDDCFQPLQRNEDGTFILTSKPHKFHIKAFGLATRDDIQRLQDFASITVRHRKETHNTTYSVFVLDENKVKYRYVATSVPKGITISHKTELKEPEVLNCSSFCQYVFQNSVDCKNEWGIIEPGSCRPIGKEQPSIHNILLAFAEFRKLDHLKNRIESKAGLRRLSRAERRRPLKRKMEQQNAEKRKRAAVETQERIKEHVQTSESKSKSSGWGCVIT